MCPAKSLAGYTSAAGRATYLYSYGYNYAEDPAKLGLAGHADELYLLFGWSPTWSAAKQGLANTLKLYWSSFVITGAPVALGSPAWPPYNNTVQSYVLLDTPVTAKNGYRTQECSMWANFNATNMTRYYQMFGYCIGSVTAAPASAAPVVTPPVVTASRTLGSSSQSSLGRLYPILFFLFSVIVSW